MIGSTATARPDLVDRPAGLRPFEWRLLGAGLALLVLWTCFHQLGAETLGDWDEATYAQIAREMLRSGQWLTPVWNGHLFYDKPPLVFWLMSAAMSQLGSPELAVRLAPAVCGVLTIALTVWLAREMSGDAAAVVAGLVLVIGSQHPYGNFVRLARQGMLDVPLTACTVWAVLLFYRGIRDPRAWRLLGAPIGLGFMVKSFAIVTPLTAIAGSLVLLPLVGVHLSRQHWRALGVAAAIALAIALPWHVLELVEHGRAFVHSYVFQNVVEKVGAGGADQGDGRLFYVRVIASGMPAWSWVIVPAGILLLWRLVRQADVRALVLLVWTVGPLLLFSLAHAKLKWYVLPIYPGLAIMIAMLVDTLVPRPARLVLLGALLAATLAWNARALEPLPWTLDAKTLGACVQKLTRLDETVGFFDSYKLYQGQQRDFWNIRPAVRFYADRPMVAFVDRPAVEQWLRHGGLWLWTEIPGDDVIADLFDVVGHQGSEVLLERRSGEPTREVPRPCPGDSGH